MGEGAPYTGLQPAGSSEGPVIPLAEAAVASGSAEEVRALSEGELRGELERRLGTVTALARGVEESVAAAREYVQAILGFELYSHKTYLAIHAIPIVGRLPATTEVFPSGSALGNTGSR